MPELPHVSPPPPLEGAAHSNRSTLVSQAVRLSCKAAGVLILARLVSPTEHGLFAMTSSVLFFLLVFRDGGLGTAAVQARALDETQRATLSALHPLIGATLMLAAAALSPFATRFYATPAVAPLLLTCSLAFLLIGLGGFARSQLARELRFAEINRLETAAAVAGTLLMILAAALGAGAYSFAVFLLASEGINTVLAWRAFGRRPRGPICFRSVRPLVRTGLDLTAYESLRFLQSQIDAIAIGRWFGAGALGLYNRSGQLLALGNQHITAPLSQVALAGFARLGSAATDFPRQASRAVTFIAHLSLPLATASLVVPGEIIQLVLGRQWTGAAPLLQWLAVSAALNAIISSAYNINVASGQTRRLSHGVLLSLPALALGVLLGSRHGPVGIAAGLAVAHAVLVGPRLWWMLRGSPIGLRAFTAAWLGPVGANAALAAGLLAGRVATAGAEWPIRLGAALALGAGAMALLVAFWPRLRREAHDVRLNLPWWRTA